MIDIEQIKAAIDDVAQADIRHQPQSFRRGFMTFVMDGFKTGVPATTFAKTIINAVKLVTALMEEQNPGIPSTLDLYIVESGIIGDRAMFSICMGPKRETV
jgi:hypothetical protein